MESKRQYQADGEAGNRTQETHDAVKGRKDDGDDDEDDSRHNADGNLEDAPAETG